MNKLTNKKTIAIVAPYFPPRGGGLERYAYEVSSRLSNIHEYRVIVITTAGRNQKDTVTEENGMTVYRLAYGFRLSNTPFSFKWFFKIRHILKRENPQIINIHMPVPGIGDIVSLLSGSTPIVVTYHAASMRKDKSRLNFMVGVYETYFLPLILNKAVQIVCSSDFIRLNFLKKYKDKSITVTPGVDSELFQPDLTKKTSYPSVLFVAGLDWSEQYKGLQKLINSIIEVKKSIPDIKLIVVGEGDMKEEYIRRVCEFGLEDSVEFTGRLVGESLAEQYQKAHVFVRPSANESFGMVALEAMSSGLPVIMTDVGGAREIISDGTDGFLVESNNVRQMTSKLLELLQNKNLHSSFASLAREKVLHNFSWLDKSKKYHNIFDEVLIKNNIKLRNLNRIIKIDKNNRESLSYQQLLQEK